MRATPVTTLLVRSGGIISSRQCLPVATIGSPGVAPRPENGKSRADPAARVFPNDLVE
jgi:hypothetical protein